MRNKHGALLKGLMWCSACDAPMLHAITTKGKRRYRYYVCSQAQKRGWKTCPSKSLPAGEIEQFVVRRIRDIGKDPALLQDTLEAVARERERSLESLRADERRLKGEMQRLRNEERGLITNAAQDGLAGSVLADRLAEIQERMQHLGRRHAEMREQILAMEGNAIDEDDLRNALSLFDPVWEQLFPKEQARIFNLLIQRIDYDGGEGTLEIAFRDTGIKTLQEELTEDE